MVECLAMTLRKIIARLLVLAVTLATGASAQTAQSNLFTRSLLHAHNCYPENGQWSDRLERALSTGVLPLAIEQDLVWVPGPNGSGRSVVSHGAPLNGGEPTLEAHFFQALAPRLDALLAAGDTASWPRYVLHLDFKTNEVEHHRAVWALLGRYERFLTTAPKTAVDGIEPLRVGPLLVITENGPGQSTTFYETVPLGARLRLFGTVPPPALTDSTDRAVQMDALITATPNRLLPSPATNYRRWANFPWAVVEHGGPPMAGAWEAADNARLQSITSRARTLGLWLRFYTLNGHDDAGQGWSAGYNFGTLAAAQARWRAAVAAGVTFIATDQYEAFAKTQ